MSDGLRVEVLCDPARDAELEAFLRACPTSYAQQTPVWRDLVADVGGDEAQVLLCRSGRHLRGALLAYRFDGGLGAVLGSAAGAGPLGGVVLHPDGEPEPVYRVLLGAFLDLARDSGCALASVLTNPFWPDRELCERHLAPDYRLENVCQALDLASAFDSDGALRASSGNLRRNLRRGRTAGFEIDEAATPETVAAWYAIHTARHAEIGATPLPRTLFTGALERAAARGVARFFFVRESASGELVGGGLYVHHGQVIDALMPAVGREAAARGANFLLAEHSIRFARERGFRFYNWQASPPGGGVYRFKRQWGSRDFGYAYLTRVTGDVAPLLESSPAELRRRYPWHFVLPFDQVGEGRRGAGGTSSREAAWRAAEGG